MDGIEGRNVTKNIEAEAKVASMSWKEKQEFVQTEENVLRKDIEDLETWVDLIETMNDDQLKGYLENNLGDSKMTRDRKRKNEVDLVETMNDNELIGNSKITTDRKMKNKVQSTGKSKSSISNGIMASVWKFDKN